MQEWRNKSLTHSCLSEMEEYTEKSKNICKYIIKTLPF